MNKNLGFSNLPEGFVYLKDIDPSIKTNLRYFTNENFAGRKIEGYNKNLAIITYDAANALSKVQRKLNMDGYELITYDLYRPQTATNYFLTWSQDNEDNVKERSYYPYIDKSTLFDLGYISRKSAHSRGSTVDLSIIEIGKDTKAVEEISRQLKDGREILYLDDNSLDMGSSFDLFDEVSHYDNNLIENLYKERRLYLRNIMESEGFEHYESEWWHFTYKNELFKDQYFEFPIE